MAFQQQYFLISDKNLSNELKNLLIEYTKLIQYAFESPSNQGFAKLDSLESKLLKSLSDFAEDIVLIDEVESEKLLNHIREMKSINISLYKKLRKITGKILIPNKDSSHLLALLNKSSHTDKLSTLIKILIQAKENNFNIIQISRIIEE
jgi:hypothetical protein